MYAKAEQVEKKRKRRRHYNINYIICIYYTGGTCKSQRTRYIRYLILYTLYIYKYVYRFYYGATVMQSYLPAVYLNLYV